MWRGSMTFETPMLWAIGGVFVFDLLVARHRFYVGKNFCEPIRKSINQVKSEVPSLEDLCLNRFAATQSAKIMRCGKKDALYFFFGKVSQHGIRVTISVFEECCMPAR